MKTFAIRLLAFAILYADSGAAPVVTAVYAAPDRSAAAPTKGQEEEERSSSPGQRGDGLRERLSRSLCHDLRANDYASAIPQLKALGHDDVAAVANLIGTPIASSATTRSRRSGTMRGSNRSGIMSRPAVLRAVAGRTGQPRSGAISSESRIAALTGTGQRGIRSLAAALESRRERDWFTDPGPSNSAGAV